MRKFVHLKIFAQASVCVAVSADANFDDFRSVASCLPS